MKRILTALLLLPLLALAQTVELKSSNVKLTGGTIDGIAIGGTTKAAVAATTVSANGQITSTLADGTAPLVVASTTNIPNLNASTLSGATFAAPGAIGGGTAAAGSFTTLNASGTSTLGVVNASNLMSIARNANSTQIQLAVRNTDATGSGAGQARIDWGNNAGPSAGTIGIYSSTHATQPSQFEILNQGNAALQLGGWGADVIALINAGVGNSVNSNRLLWSMTAPTISSGFGSSPAILSSNGTTTFRINVGTGGTATGGVLGMPTATTGWNCQFSVLNPTDTNMLSENTETSSTTTTVTITNNLISTGSATAWPASTTIIAFCAAY